MGELSTISVTVMPLKALPKFLSAAKPIGSFSISSRIRASVSVIDTELICASLVGLYVVIASAAETPLRLNLKPLENLSKNVTLAGSVHCPALTFNVEPPLIFTLLIFSALSSTVVKCDCRLRAVSANEIAVTKIFLATVSRLTTVTPLTPISTPAPCNLPSGFEPLVPADHCE